MEYQPEPGAAKDEDYGFDAWHEAMELLPNSFIEANSAQVDIVSGATSTSNMAIEAVDMALQKAQGVTKFEGTYLGFSEKSERGNHGVAWVTVKDGEITEIELKKAAEGEV
ncbi:FMN-binding protein [Fuchsiella alkaliacetigena]|nr:FMN-binding protein [Fuchsiella alkaliacetigena]